MLLMHLMDLALSFARASAGNSMLARMAMMAITTSNSIKVNPGEPFFCTSRMDGAGDCDFMHPL